MCAVDNCLIDILKCRLSTGVGLVNVNNWTRQERENRLVI
jgi:hypothetical protein